MALVTEKYQNHVPWKMVEIEAPPEAVATEEGAMAAPTFIQMSTKFMPPFNECNHPFLHLVEVEEGTLRVVPKDLIRLID